MAKKYYLLLTFMLVIGFLAVRTLRDASGPSENDKRCYAECARAELPRARRLWESFGITSYDLDYYYLGHPVMDEGTIQVRAGIVGQNLRSGFTISSMFERLEERLEQQRLNSDEMILWVKFHPIYGFITEYAAGPSINSDSRWLEAFQFSNFRPVAATP